VKPVELKHLIFPILSKIDDLKSINWSSFFNYKSSIKRHKNCNFL